MTFYGNNFRNMLVIEKANDLGDLTIKFENDELHSMREYYYEFPNRAPLIIRVLTCMCTPAW